MSDDDKKPIVHDSGVPTILTAPLDDGLKAAFDAWEPAPVEEETPDLPSAPSEAKESAETKETSETKAAHKPDVDPVEPPAEVAEEPREKEPSFERRVKRAPSEDDIRDVTDPKPKTASEDGDFETLELRSDAPEAQQSQFKKLKLITQKFSAEAKAYRGKLEPILKEHGLTLPDNPADVENVLEQFSSKLRERPVINPAVAAKHQFLEQLANETDIKNSLDYVDQIETPIRNGLQDWIADLAQYSGASPQDIQKFQNEVLNTDPHLILKNPSWFSQQRDAIARDGKMDQAAYDRLRFKEANLTEIERNGQKFVGHLLTNEQARQALAQRNAEQGQRVFAGSVRDEVDKLTLNDPELKELRELFPKDPAKETDAEKRAEIEAKNKRFDEELQPKFRQFLIDSSSGPRAAARRALQYIKITEENRKLKSVANENAALQKEIKSLRSEVTTRRRIRDTGLRPDHGNGGKPSTPEKQRLTSTKNPDFSSL